MEPACCGAGLMGGEGYKLMILDVMGRVCVFGMVAGCDSYRCAHRAITVISTAGRNLLCIR